MVNWLKHHPTLKHLEIVSCVFDGGFVLNSHELPPKSIPIINFSIDDCRESSETKGFISFLLTLIAPKLPYLKIRQPLGITVNLPQLEQLQYIPLTWGRDEGSLSRLPILKHLRVSIFQTIAYVARLVTELHHLEGRLCWREGDKLDDFHDALNRLPKLQVLTVTFFADSQREWVPSTPTHLDFYRTKGRHLKGLLITAHFTHRSVLECITLNCPGLTHLGVCCDFGFSPPLIGPENVVALVQSCPKLRKVALCGVKSVRLKIWATQLEGLEGLTLCV